MASGKTHDKITVIMSPFAAGIFFLINFSKSKDIGNIIAFTILGVAVYIFGGYMFSGDVDIESVEFNRWGPLKVIWRLYQRLFSHRSIFTHGFILGPAIRILYVYGIYLIICALLYALDVINLSTSQLIKATALFMEENKQLSFNIIVALFLGSGLHTLTDLIYSFFKKIFKGKKRPRRGKKRKNYLQREFLRKLKFN
ncbi:metal-binding protein [Clostridium gasigenes]|nr:metal-binding protein [Clostridium gasigenes]NKF08019.1 metal-binding protein [Clostridium gasigenes]QSW20605.1 metal-binding protein [Clostridium gasigenes]